MLSNRVFRLVTTALLLIGAFLVCMLYGSIFIQNERYEQDTLVLMPALLAFVVCLVDQICWDFLDVSFLNGSVGMKIKQILYFAKKAIPLIKLASSCNQDCLLDISLINSFHSY